MSDHISKNKRFFDMIDAYVNYIKNEYVSDMHQYPCDENHMRVFTWDHHNDAKKDAPYKLSVFTTPKYKNYNMIFVVKTQDLEYFINSLVRAYNSIITYNRIIEKQDIDTNSDSVSNFVAECKQKLTPITLNDEENNGLHHGYMIDDIFDLIKQSDEYYPLYLVKQVVYYPLSSRVLHEIPDDDVTNS